METLYDILEVSKKASKEIIEKAYKTLEKKYHPDLQNSDNEKKIAEERMKAINEAYSVLSDEQKRAEYDLKLQHEEEIEKYKNSSQENAEDHYEQDYDEDEMYENDWKKQYANLSPKEQKRVARKIQKEANEEYRKQYEEYFRSLGYRIKHRMTLKDYITIFAVIVALVIIFLILWVVPPTHEWMMELYNENLVVQIIVNIIIGIGKGIATFCKNITKF